MEFLDKIIQFHNKPFPEERWFGLSKNILIISVSMTLFLFKMLAAVKEANNLSRKLDISQYE